MATTKDYFDFKIEGAKELDKVFSRWSGEEGSKETGDVVANALGAAFGRYLAEKHGFAWIVLKDQHGTALAVRHKVNETTAFPVESVKKRIEDKKTDFFDNIYVILLNRISGEE